MRRALAAATILALLALPAFAAEAGVRERNRAWVLAQLGEAWDPQESGVLHTFEGASVLSQAVALERVLDRMGAVDMAALTSAAATTGFPGAGDVWLLEVGSNPCPEVTVLGPNPTAPPLDAQFWFYYGAYGYAISEVSIGGVGYAIEWTFKDLHTYHDKSVFYGGISDFFCLEWGRMTLNFPFIDGVAQDLPA